ncbi:MAG TPA: hypothetical protein VFX92_12765 [Candidatus Krumholzibacteria bacterium]|nr:hypothetical protein [Candidatus Krumholzibacteria bacterium]
MKDLDLDGRADLVVELRTERLPLRAADLVVEVWGSTRRGGVFSGTDLVQIR